MDPRYFQSVGIIHETTAPYTPQQKWCRRVEKSSLERDGKLDAVLLGVEKGFWGEAMLIACYVLNRVLNKRNKIPPY